jgi:hypothetical protein
LVSISPIRQSGDSSLRRLTMGSKDNELNSALMKIYIVTHQQSDFPKENIYVPIQVGFSDTFLETRDNTGINIAEKNATFCELTALYWIWKNDKESKVTGLVHYRRYLTKRWYSNSEKYFLSRQDIAKSLNKADIILPKKYRWRKPNVREYYSMADGRDSDYMHTRDVIRRLTPEYLDAFDQVSASHTASYCNMLICRKDLFDSYCGWLFYILFQLESETNLDGYTDMEKRIYGFLSEILLNVWVRKNKLKVAEFPIVKTDTPTSTKVKRKLTRLIFYVP